MRVSVPAILLSASHTKVQPISIGEAWPAKYAFGFKAVFISFFLRVSRLTVLLWFARAGATIFILFQQVILIDVAYTKRLVDRADQADRLNTGAGVWLAGLSLPAWRFIYRQRRH
jgi:hypothetical protein